MVVALNERRECPSISQNGCEFTRRQGSITLRPSLIETRTSRLGRERQPTHCDPGSDGLDVREAVDAPGVPASSVT